jgi:hypothetical protein
MMQLVLIVLTKRKEMIRYCGSFRYGVTTLSNTVANDLTHVSVPTEDRSIIPIMGISHHPHYAHFTSSLPWAFHINVLQLSTNNQIIS